ncbi:TadE/TadG family type IV pilus assembly protein [Oceanobacillus sp. CFH 90083]|uniref:TadE/TadG family type IV pilus assembly protein n=1 Tax=Oceanobacillus sp. CFH 90083 TaxID=2592336 RepID=UPI00128DBE0B|nr:TadE family protein [Oceanobacillus sp. CFH 90083]
MKPFIKEERGSFTIESTLVFPALLIFTLIGVFFCIIIFQMGTAGYMAHKVSSELAYTWNNSYKDIKTGDFEKSRYTGLEGEHAGDSLYWRVTDNDILGFFNLSGFSGESLIEKKMDKSLVYDGSISLNVNYNNILIYSEVEVKAESSLFIPSFLKNMIGSKVQATSSHVVTETPELVRTANFAKYLWSEFGKGGAVGDAVNSIKKFFGGE